MDLLDKTENQSLSLSDFLATARSAVEKNLPACWIAGEVSNLTRAASGHSYFVLRDSTAQADCVLLRQFNSLLPAPLKEGDAVEILAQASIYTPRGRFQLMVRYARHTGAGRLYQLYAERKQLWAQKGWFASDAKKTLPFLPTTIGVVGSLQGAALRDVLRLLKTRMPSINVIVYPAPAQGEDAARKIAAAITTANQRREEDKCDILIVCRGGGGIEDLWAYNEEPVVAAIVKSTLPIISGIGHEIDETLADFAADVRAPTPTAAAVFATPDKKELQLRLSNAHEELNRATRRCLGKYTQQLDFAAAAISRPHAFIQNQNTRLTLAAAALSRAVNTHIITKQQHMHLTAAAISRPHAFIQNQTTRLTLAAAALSRAVNTDIITKQQRMQTVSTVMRACNPRQTLARGYSIVHHDGNIVRSGGTLAHGNRLQITFARGTADATVDTASDFDKIGL
ncbi:MAG: exodeoxyribonuclease VII large subunit [Gammaproteobacteria bacterium WSBS_2016_MAG_OTU1]